MLGTFEYTLGALLLTMILGYVFETVKMELTLFQVQKINKEIVKLLDEAIDERDQIDIFFIDHLRQVIAERFMVSKRIDDFKIYKATDTNIRLAYKHGMAVQQFELHVERHKHSWQALSSEYIENPFEDVQL